MSKANNTLQSRIPQVVAIYKLVQEREALRRLWDTLHTAFIVSDDPMFGIFADEVARIGSSVNADIQVECQRLAEIHGDTEPGENPLDGPTC